jgi:UMP-CMP kinase
MEEKPRVIFVLGGPGSGKGTHCDLLKKRYNFTHYSVGDILREFLKSGTKDAQVISNLMKEGKMVPGETAVNNIKEKVLKGDKSKLILVDGFPRNQ